MLSWVRHILQQIILAERAFDLHKRGLKYGRGGRSCRTRSCVSAGKMLDRVATSPRVVPSLVHRLPAVQVCWGGCDVRSVGASAPLQRGGAGGEPGAAALADGLVCYTEIAVFSCCVSKTNPNRLMLPALPAKMPVTFPVITPVITRG